MIRSLPQRFEQCRPRGRHDDESKIRNLIGHQSPSAFITSAFINVKLPAAPAFSQNRPIGHYIGRKRARSIICPLHLSNNTPRGRPLGLRNCPKTAAYNRLPLSFLVGASLPRKSGLSRSRIRIATANIALAPPSPLAVFPSPLLPKSTADKQTTPASHIHIAHTTTRGINTAHIRASLWSHTNGSEGI